MIGLVAFFVTLSAILALGLCAETSRRITAQRMHRDAERRAASLDEALTWSHEDYDVLYAEVAQLRLLQPARGKGGKFIRRG